MARTPKLGGELPAYNTMGATKPKKPRKIMPRIMSTGMPGTSKFVQRSPREDIGMPGTKNFVPRSPKVSTGMPGTKNYVQRTPDGVIQRKPSGLGRVMGVLRTKLSAPRKPAK